MKRNERGITLIALVVTIVVLLILAGVSISMLTSDGQMKTILKNAEALIFPSFYEGFGIPPLEALAVNTKAIVSNISVLREIFENSVYYINPYNTNVNLEKILVQEVENRDKVLKKFSWKQSAQKLLKILKEEKYESSNNT